MRINSRLPRLFIIACTPLLMIGLLFFFTPKNALAETVITVTTDIDELNDDGDCSLREAIETANTGSSVDSCVMSGSGDIVIELPADNFVIIIGTDSEDANLEGDFDIRTSLTIRGAGVSKTLINGNSTDRIFDIDPLDVGDVEVFIEALTVENGRIPFGTKGGGIRMHDDSLTLTNVTISDNQIPVGGDPGTFGAGAGIYNQSGTLTIIDSEIIDNLNNKGLGGGIAIGDNLSSNAVLNMSGTLVANNRALQPTGTTSGGGIFATNAQVNILNSTIIDNFVEGQGGGVSLGSFSGETNIVNTTIANNVSTGSGGGIRNFGTLYMSFSTLTNNTASGSDDSEFGDAGGLRNNGTAVLKANIIYGNFDNTTPGENNIFPDISDTGTLTSTGFNMIGAITGTNAIVHNINNDFVGVDPELQIPTDSGNYFIPDLGSVPLNIMEAEDCTINVVGLSDLFTDGMALLFDQIGNPRPDGFFGKCDIGAIEAPYQYTYLPRINALE